MRCLINGIKAEYIDIKDRGLHYGDGLFETLLLADGKIQFFDEHMARLQSGADKLGICFPGVSCYLEDLTTLVKQSAAAQSSTVQSSTAQQVIKLLLTRGSSERGYAIPDRAMPKRITMLYDYSLPDAFSSAIQTRICKQNVSINQSLAGLKHLNRLDNVLARAELDKTEHEGLMLDGDGFVIEGSMSNLFVVKDGALLTPDLSRSGVNGIIREQILKLAQSENIKTDIIQMTINDVFAADEVFICNSLIGIVPLSRIDTTEYKTGKLCLHLQPLLQQITDRHAQALD